MADLATVVDDAGRLDVAGWRSLTPARRNNALRAWLLTCLERGAPETLIERLMVELPDAADARWPVDPVRQLALYRGRLELTAAAPVGRAAPPGEQTLDLSRSGVYTLPQWHGAFEVVRTAEAGVPASRLKACRVVARSGGEQWQAGPRSVPRSLKKQYQAAGVAAWQREGPLLYAGEQLAFVPGLGVDARVCSQAPHGRRTVLALQWRPDGADAPRRATKPQRLKSPPP
jgi:tRNA(Ile)-lysidine synthase